MKFVSTILATLLITSTAIAQEAPQAPQGPKCFAREKLVPLMTRGGAAPVMVARTGDYLFEVWADVNGESWAGYRTARDGTMCPVVIGQGHVATTEQRICIDPNVCPRA